MTVRLVSNPALNAQALQTAPNAPPLILQKGSFREQHASISAMTHTMKMGENATLVTRANVETVL
jgi:hypothetical protein